MNIYEKYNHYIIQARSNYLSGIQYPEVIEILRYCEAQVGRSIPINTSCANCILDLVKLFDRLKK